LPERIFSTGNSRLKRPFYPPLFQRRSSNWPLFDRIAHTPHRKLQQMHKSSFLGTHTRIESRRFHTGAFFRLSPFFQPVSRLKGLGEARRFRQGSCLKSCLSIKKTRSITREKEPPLLKR